MSNIFTILTTVLSGNEKFCSAEGKLLKNKIAEAANKNDSDLLKALLNNEDLKKAFFVNIDGVEVFDKTSFGWVVNNREFLPDSFTRFKNKIGLSNRMGDMISATSDVVLSFPYKDCVLEGGQTKEDQRRDEKFFNTVLAPDEIDKMFSPKVLTNPTRCSAAGLENVTEMNDDENILVKGNNLLSLSSLKRRYGNKIRMAYWDVPYNTGADSFKYNDKFSRSSWLVFIKNRVEQVMPLLDPISGVLLIQCSFHHYAYLKVLLDEIVGNYVMTFNVLVRHPERTLTADKEYNDVVEYVLVYSKSPSFKMPKIAEDKTVDNYQWTVKELSEGKEIEFEGRKGRIFEPGEYELTKVEPAKENFKIITVRGSIKEKVSSGRFYVKYLQPLENQYPSKTLFKVDNIGDDMYDYRYFYLPPKGNKNGADLQGMPTSTNKTYKPYPNFIDFVQSYNTVNDEGVVEFRNGKKPEDLIAFLMEIFTSEGDYVLDAFAGSGTTGAVAIKLNRRFVLCEQMDYIEDTTRARLLGVVKGEENDTLTEYEYSGGGSFLYFELKKQNQAFIDRAKNAESDSELKDILNDAIKTGYISCQVNPKKIEANITDFDSLSTDQKKEFIMSLIDANLLYVNMDDIDDAEFAVTDAEKAFSRSFYNMEA